MLTGNSSRRDFLRAAAAVASAGAGARQAIAETGSGSDTGIPTRLLGKTGVRVSIIGVGGAHARAIKDDAECIRFMHTAVGEGINFFDNAWDYSNGAAEEIMGKALAIDGYRNKVFLMTKNCGRDDKESAKCLEDSLRRLQTDHLDLWQFHEMNWDNDPDWIFERGAIKVAMEARKAGKLFDWDTSQMPINVMDAHYRSFQNEVVPVLLKRKIGVIGIKGFGGGRGNMLGKEGLTVEECLRYCLSLPITTQVVGMTSMEQLKQDVAIARNFQPMSAAEKSQLLARVKEVAGDGRYELFKSTQTFEGVVHRRQHGFEVKAP